MTLTKRWSAVVLLLAVPMASPGEAASQNQALHIPVCEKAPLIDGRLDDGVWQTAMRIETTYLHSTDQPVKDTTFRLCRDDAWLFLGVRAFNTNMPHVGQVTFNHDGSVQRDDSVEVFIRPEAGNGRYYHFILSFANVKHEKRITDTGARDMSWSAPWRTMTARLADGWTGEMAIPLYALETDDLGGASINLCRNLITVELDPYGAKQDEKRIFHALKKGNKGSPHGFANFRAATGLGGFKPTIPFAPLVAAAELIGYRQEEGKSVYDVDVLLDTASPVAGQALLQVLEDGGEGYLRKLSETVALDGTQRRTLSVPCESFETRRVKVALVDPKDGNLLAVREITDTSALSVIKKVFVGRSYYTTEDAAHLRLELSLPESVLQGATLRIDVNGKNMPDIRGLKPVMTPKIRTEELKIGDNAVEVRIFSDGKELVSKQLAVRRLEPRPGFETKTDHLRGVLLKDGVPVFPVGIFTHTLGYGVEARGVQDGEEDMFRFLGDVGFNTLVRLKGYKDVGTFMRLAEKYGLDAITWSSPQPRPMSMLTPPRSSDLPLPERLRIHRAWYEELEPEIIEETKRFREHKNLLGYYNVDEPNLVNRNERIAVAEWYWDTVTPIDPHRPLYLLYSKHIPHGDNWTRWGQILGYDVYPRAHVGGFYSEPGLATAYYAYDLRKRCRQDNKVMIFVPLGNMLNPERSPVGLSKAQMLCQAYTSIIYGARGLLYFALSNVVGEEAWDGLRTICAHVRNLTPALVNGEVAQTIRYTPDHYRPEERQFPAVNAAVFKYPDGDFLLMAVNIIPYGVDTTFRVEGLKSATRLFADAEKEASGGWASRLLGRKDRLPLDGGAFTEKIEPYGVRAYRLRVREADSIKVAVDMTALEEEKATDPGLRSIIRRVMLGKNHVPNPTFKQQTNKGIPDFYRPYFCLSTEPTAGQKGSGWYVDHEVTWQGNPSLRMFRRLLKEPGNITRGTFGVCYPPASDKPVQMTFSFYARSDKKGTGFTVIMFGQRPSFRLTEEWARYHMTFDVPPGGTQNLGARGILMAPSLGVVWVSGLQLEAGDTPTEFQDDSVVVKKKIADDPGNLIRNGNAEHGSATFWSGLENLTHGEPGLRRGEGRTGDYAFLWRGQSTAIQSDPVNVDPTKAYRLQAFLKSEDGPLPRMTFGLIMYDAEQRQMRHWHVFPLRGARPTELTVDCRPGDTVLKVKDASGWKPGPSYVVAFGPEDRAPNFDITPPAITAITPEADHWRVVLKDPCGRAFPAGTHVTEKRAGGNGIFLPGPGETAEGEWTEFEGTIRPQQWWPGTAYAAVIVQPKPDGKPGTVLLDDVSLRPAPLPPR